MRCAFKAKYGPYLMTASQHRLMRTISAIATSRLLRVCVFVRVEMSELELGMNKISVVRREVEEQEQNFHMLRAQKAATRLELQKKVSKNLQHQIKMQKQQYDKQNLYLLCFFFVYTYVFFFQIRYFGNSRMTLSR